MKQKLFFSLMLMLALNTFAQIPTNDLVARYNFSNGALTDAVNNVSFTKVGSASTTIMGVDGDANGAISLNGDDLLRSDIEFDVNNNTNPYLPKTISFWLKTSTNDNAHRIIYHDNDQASISDASYLGLKVYLQNGKINALYKVGGNGGVKTHPTVIADNEWHHVVIQAYSEFLTTSPYNRFYAYVYVDNVKIGGTNYLASASGVNIADDNKHVGDIVFSRLRDASVASIYKYEDGIDNILIYTRILTDTEVAKAGGFSGTLYVNSAATGLNNGKSWANAFTDLQDALNSTLTVNEIWVAKGTYKPSVTDRDASFVLNTNIYGGFNGTETSLSERDLSLISTTNETILSGDLSGDDAIVSYNDATRSDNSKHVVEVVVNDLEINGFTIKDGHADAITGDDRFGAGIFKNISLTDLTIKNCTIKNNVALSGAGVSLSVSSTCNFTIDASIFDGNLANTAAGIDVHMSATNNEINVNVTNSLFKNNKTDDDTGKGRKGSGAATIRARAYFSGVVLNATIVNNTFVNNSSLGDSGSSVKGNFPVIGLSERDGGFGAVKIVNNIFWGNVKHSSQVAKAIGASHSLNDALNYTDVLRIVENNTDEDGLSTFIGIPLNTISVDPDLDANFKLNSGSSSINAGNNSFMTLSLDLAGNQRIFNTTVDRGAYEFDSVPLQVNNFYAQVNELSVFPNPTTSFLNIKMNNKLKRATIYSLLGSKILETKSKIITTGSFKNGLYIIKIEDENGIVFTKRFIKK
jgi:hypothetical protein